MADPSDLLVRRAHRVFGAGTFEAEADDPVCIVVRRGRVERLVAESQLGSVVSEVFGAAYASGDLPELDAAGRAVIPGFVDAHTHLVFAGDRSEEFGARLAGVKYEAGGIMTSVDATRAASVEELTAGVVERAGQCLRSGTTTVEVKSGYGLETDAEVRSLQAVAAANDSTPTELVPTFLGAHLDLGGDYIDTVINEMLPACAPLAVSCDAFCDIGALNVESSRLVLEAGVRHGLVPRIHAEELAHTGAAELAAELSCASADHLVYASESDCKALASAGVVGVLLPATSFCLRSSYAPARMLIESGVTVALASDCNPGTSYTSSMPFVIAVACSEYGMSADEAVAAATSGGAAALRRSDIGHLNPGARADMIVMDAEHWVDFAYRPGMDVIAYVVKDGVVVR